MNNENTKISFRAKTSISAIGYKINIGVKTAKTVILSTFRFLSNLYKKKKYIVQANDCNKKITHLKFNSKILESSIASCPTKPLFVKPPS